VNPAELKKQLTDYRHYANVANLSNEFTQIEHDVKLLNSLNIVVGEKYEKGLRVRIYFDLSEEQRDQLEYDFSERIYFPQGMLYYPIDEDWFNRESIHLQYRSEHSGFKISEQAYHQHQAMLRILHEVLSLAYLLDLELTHHQDKSATTSLKGLAFVNHPAVWPHLPHIFRWLGETGLPMWEPLDFLRKTLEQIRADEIGRSGYIYLLEGTQGWFKIGRSKEPTKRIEKLGVVLPFPIETKHIIVTDDMYKAESRLHEIFSHCRGQGEWFALNADEVQALCGLDDIFFMPQRNKL
jgi:hypothetical protein